MMHSGDLINSIPGRFRRSNMIRSPSAPLLRIGYLAGHWFPEDLERRYSCGLSISADHMPKPPSRARLSAWPYSTSLIEWVPADTLALPPPVCLHRRKADIDVPNEALAHQAAILILIDNVAANVLTVDHFPKIAAGCDATAP